MHASATKKIVDKVGQICDSQSSSPICMLEVTKGWSYSSNGFSRKVV
jgi:hypothetical protein